MGGKLPPISSLSALIRVLCTPEPEGALSAAQAERDARRLRGQERAAGGRQHRARYHHAPDRGDGAPSWGCQGAHLAHPRV